MHEKIDIKKVKENVGIVAATGAALARMGAEAAKNNVVRTAHNVQNSTKETIDSVKKNTKEAQRTVLSFVDKKMNARYIDAKLTAFEDGIKEGKIQAVDQIKKYANFCLATTALSFYFARVDGEIDPEEMKEIQSDLAAILKNRDIPQAIRDKVNEISEKEDLTFEEVKSYLDGVSVDTLLELQNDIEEIISADGIENPKEREARDLFYEYLGTRMEKRNE